MEVSSLIPSSQNRSADVYLPSWKGGHPAALDVTVISTMQQATIQGAAISHGYALLVGEERKMAAHADTCQAVGVSFIPLVVETLGGMSGSCVSTLACLGRLLGQRLGIPPVDSIRHLFQRCAISLMTMEGECSPMDTTLPNSCPFCGWDLLTCLFCLVCICVSVCGLRLFCFVFLFLLFYPLFFGMTCYLISYMYIV